MEINKTKTFIELTIVDSQLVNVPIPHKGLFDIRLISSLEDLGDKSPLKNRCMVTLVEAVGSTIQNGDDEDVVLGYKTVMVKESYQELL